MNDPLMILAVSTILGIVQTALWRWVSAISDAVKHNQANVEQLRVEIYRDFVSKDEIEKEIDKVLAVCNDIKHDMRLLNDKLDKKMDK